MKKEVLKHIKHSKKPHILYLVALQHPTTNEMFCKIGVSAYSIQMRFIDSDYEVKYSREFQFQDGIQARGWESLLIEKLIPYHWHYYPKDKSFAGKTECYELPKTREIESIMDNALTPKKRGRKKKEVITPAKVEENELILEEYNEEYPDEYSPEYFQYYHYEKYDKNKNYSEWDEYYNPDKNKYDYVPEETEKIILWGDVWEI